MKSSDPLSGDCLSSNFGIRVQGLSQLPLSAHGLEYSMYRSSGRSWLVRKESICLIGYATKCNSNSLLHYSILTHNETADPAHDQVPLCTIHFWQSQVQSAEWTLIYEMRLVLKKAILGCHYTYLHRFFGFPMYDKVVMFRKLG